MSGDANKAATGAHPCPYFFEDSMPADYVLFGFVFVLPYVHYWQDSPRVLTPINRQPVAGFAI